MSHRKQNYLYRAVSDNELADIKKNGIRNKIGAYETGKLFALSFLDAIKFGKNKFLFDNLCNTIIRVSLPTELNENLVVFEADGMAAVLIEKEYLILLEVYFFNYSSIQ